MDLFDHAAQKDQQAREPLAERMRPRKVLELVGQEHLTGEGRFLRRAILSDQVPSLILWGPPGTGKTTVAQVVAHSTGAAFVTLSAVMGGVKDIREAVAQAQLRWKERRQRTLLFVDEIHRFNKAQQDALLPHVERGTVTLIGATTENPSFEVNAALLSRCRVVILRPLEEEELELLLRRAVVDERGLAGRAVADDEALRLIARFAAGDARRALTALEVAAAHSGGKVDRKAVEETLQHRTLLYDKGGEEHFNVVSALIKSMRASDPDAALYWMTRMLEAGEDPVFVLRRLVIFASEDVGNADPRALQVAVAALQAFQLVGLPEGSLPLTQAVTYLALAPKSNAVLEAYANARAAVQEHGALAVPQHLRNVPSSPASDPKASCLPQALQGRELYRPGQQGLERELSARLAQLRGRDKKQP